MSQPVFEKAAPCPHCGHHALFGIGAAEFSAPIAYACNDCNTQLTPDQLDELRIPEQQPEEKGPTGIPLVDGVISHMKRIGGNRRHA